jgi:ABC-2 type transport system ATP-binding protein
VKILSNGVPKFRFRRGKTLKGTAMNKTVLEVKNLSRWYGRLHAVKDLSFEVREGEIFGILGPNGAGKTTTIECVLGTRQKSGGTVSMLGMDPVADRKKIFRKVGVQFQNSAWQSLIKTGELCEATACLYQPLPDWKKLLKKFDLAEKESAFVDKLSGGEKQKLSILLACIHSPGLVFLDELTTGLDPLARRKTWEFIRQLNREGVTIVMTSHYMDEVEELCGRAIIIGSGELIAEGGIQDFLELGKGKNLDEAYINLIGAKGGVA